VLPCYAQARQRAAALGRELTPVEQGVTLQLGAYPISSRFLRWVGPDGVEVFLLEQPALYERPGGLYDQGDNAARFGYFCRAVLEGSANGALPGPPPEVIHLHDWPVAPTALLLAGPYRGRLPHTRSVLTLHNLAHQGWFPARELAMLGLEWAPPPLHAPGGTLNFLRGGIGWADAVTTVSPNHAREILGSEMGFGLDSLLRGLPRPLRGILNGIDDAAWDPATDPHLPAHFTPDDLAGKTVCRKALLEEVGLPERNELVVAVVSRLDPQKGLDILADTAPWFEALGVQLVVLGTGQPALEERYRDLMARYPRRVGGRIDFDVGLSHRILAGADAVCMPSRFEPCGLTQLFGLRYGAVPIVHPVGGLHDTVSDPGLDGLVAGHGTGLRFFPLEREALAHALARMARLRRDFPDGLARLRRVGMTWDSSWDRPARHYLDLYAAILGA
jgi:starch synthase